MKKKYIISIISFIIFLIIMILVTTNNIIQIDEAIYNNIISYRCAFLDTFFKIITQLANPIPVIIIISLLVIFLKRNDAILLSVNILTSLLLNQILKNVIARPRPNHLKLIKETGYSYPSGHSMIALSLYATLIYISLKRIKNKKIRIAIISLLTLLILLIGLSRIYLGVHYPSDIIGGFFLAVSLIIMTSSITNNYLRGKNKNDKYDSK